jgi:hypothetical protein
MQEFAINIMLKIYPYQERSDRDPKSLLKNQECDPILKEINKNLGNFNARFNGSIFYS